ncbi:MAG: hypothetical protein HY051_03115 [Candidatus Aenigmarchaeota archaeon]|nr:hypothetical protein [Candidatus Aenigmarchaeota archaeon]
MRNPSGFLNVEHPATSMYVMGQKEYDELIRLSKENEEIGELLTKIKVQE